MHAGEMRKSDPTQLETEGSAQTGAERLTPRVERQRKVTVARDFTLPVPMLRVRGEWLRRAGFETGTRVGIQAAPGQLCSRFTDKAPSHRGRVTSGRHSAQGPQVTSAVTQSQMGQPASERVIAELRRRFPTVAHDETERYE